MEIKKNLLVAAGLVGGACALYGSGFIRWTELKSQKVHLQMEVAHLKVENQRLIDEMRRLREDPAYAEALYRQQFGFTRPGETVIKFKNQKEASAKR